MRSANGAIIILAGAILLTGGLFKDGSAPLAILGLIYTLAGLYMMVPQRPPSEH